MSSITTTYPPLPPFNPEVHLNTNLPLGALSLECELRRRELGTSQNKAIAFRMGDDEFWPFDELIYEDISILV